MASAADSRDHCLPYLGLPVGATLTAEDDEALKVALNASLQELLGTGERRRERRAELVRAPETVTLGAVTANNKAITFSGYASYMKGCTIKIGDDEIYNRLVAPNGTVALESPYTGDTATNVSATVYFDCITLDGRYESATVPVLWDGTTTVELVPSLHMLSKLRLYRAGSSAPTPPQGVPQYALIEDDLADDATPGMRVVFDSLPTQRATFSFMAALRPPQITSWSDTTPFFLPGQRDPLVLYPVMLFHLRTYPLFIGDAKEVEANYQVAKTLWSQFHQKGPLPRPVNAATPATPK